MGLPGNHRLKRREDFSRLYQQGKRFKTAHLTLRVLSRSPSLSLPAPSPDQDLPLPTRIGFSISLKVDKRAVVRNRIRRRLQAIMRQLLPYMSSNRDLLITVHPQAAQCDYLQFLQELEQLLVDAEVLHGYQRGCVL